MKFDILNLKKDIRLVLSDVDGTLTDGGMYYSKNSEELKKFNTKDGMGFSLLKNTGYKVGIISKEDSPIADARAKKLKLDVIELGVADKLNCVTKLCNKFGLTLKNVAYIGDDINDIELLKLSGFSACPSDANKKVKECVKVVLGKKGGDGCFREFADLLLA